MQGERVFFSSVACLPKETPEGIRALRKQELLGLQVGIMPSCCTSAMIMDRCLPCAVCARQKSVSTSLPRVQPKAVLQSGGIC